jgi:Type VI secretion system (T6SS), amidase effector protein 4
MTIAMPSFEDLRDNYPDDPSADAVKQLIGGNVNADWITNTCCIRLSRAFNKSGVKLKKHSSPPMHIVTGADGDNYAFRVREMRPWIVATFGPPTIDLRNGAPRSKFSSVVGVIAFDIQFHDATGHLDLWDGAHYIHESADPRDYFALATRTMVWVAPHRSG